MKNPIVFFIILLLIWIAGSSYFYVCKIRKDCCLDAGTSSANAVDQTLSVKTDSAEMVNLPDEVSMPEKLVVYFDLGKSECTLDREEQDHIGTIKQYLMTKAAGRIAVTGHADNSGSTAINSRISLQRAAYVKHLLIEFGVEAGSIDVAGKGELEPASDNASAEGRAKNRRVEIQIH